MQTHWSEHKLPWWISARFMFTLTVYAAAPEPTGEVLYSTCKLVFIPFEPTEATIKAKVLFFYLRYFQWNRNFFTFYFFWIITRTYRFCSPDLNTTAFAFSWNDSKQATYRAYNGALAEVADMQRSTSQASLYSRPEEMFEWNFGLTWFRCRRNKKSACSRSRVTSSLCVYFFIIIWWIVLSLLHRSEVRVQGPCLHSWLVWET